MKLFLLLASLNLDVYFKYLEDYPQMLTPLGDAKKGEIEIITDRDMITEIESKTGRQVGVIGKDKYWLWLNDAVQFPNKTYGVYGRIIWNSGLEGRNGAGVVGVGLMPVLPDGRIVLNRNYRHATRSWEYELPRGLINKGERPEDAAIRETQEETGMTLSKLHSLGAMAPDSGVVHSVIPVYMAHVVGQQEVSHDDSEAIAAIEAFSVEVIKQGFIDGKIGEIPLRDPFLSFALFQAEIRGLLPLTE